MTQAALVKRIVSPGVAEISLLRQLECALGCKDCQGCAQRPKEELLVLASNEVGAVPGDLVDVRSKAGGAATAAVVVCVLPCVALILAYLAASKLGWSEMSCVGASVLGSLLGFLPAWLIDRAIRRAHPAEFTILSVIRP